MFLAEDPETMRHRFSLYCLIILSAILLCLTLGGCSKQPSQSQQLPPEQASPSPQQPAATGTAEQMAPSATEAANNAAVTAKPATETVKAAVNKNSYTQHTAPQPVAPRTVTLDAGTQIHVATIDAFSTKTSTTGEKFEASLDKSIVDGGWTIARRGSAVQGVITESDTGGRVKGVASLSLTITGLKLADGQEVKISADTYTVTAKTTKKKDATKIGIGAGIGAAIGAIAGGGKGAAIGAGVGGAAGTGAVLATRGDPAIIPAETSITFELTSPLKITEKK
jgi:hypothetical protein